MFLCHLMALSESSCAMRRCYRARATWCGSTMPFRPAWPPIQTYARRRLARHRGDRQHLFTHARSDHRAQRHRGRCRATTPSSTPEQGLVIYYGLQQEGVSASVLSYRQAGEDGHFYAVADAPEQAEAAPA